MIVDHVPADAGRLEELGGTFDRLGDPSRQSRHVFSIGRTTQRLPWPRARNGCASLRSKFVPPECRSCLGPAPWPGQAARAASCNYRPPRSPPGSIRRRAPGSWRELGSTSLVAWFFKKPPFTRTGNIAGAISTEQAPARSCLDSRDFDSPVWIGPSAGHARLDSTSTSSAIERVRVTRVSLGKRPQSAWIPSSRNRGQAVGSLGLEFRTEYILPQGQPAYGCALIRPCSQELDTVP